MKVSTLLGLLPTAALAHDLLSVAFFAKEKTELLEFVSDNAHIDYGCRPVVMPANDEHKLHAMLTEEQVHHYKRSLEAGAIRVETIDHLNKRQAATAPIGKGDRFKEAKSPPSWVGQPETRCIRLIPERWYPERR